MHSWDETTKETENPYPPPPLKVSNDPDKRYLSLEFSFNQPQGHMWPW